MDKYVGVLMSLMEISEDVTVKTYTKVRFDDVPVEGLHFGYNYASQETDGLFFTARVKRVFSEAAGVIFYTEDEDGNACQSHTLHYNYNPRNGR